jgi:triosephosphate isomerase
MKFSASILIASLATTANAFSANHAPVRAGTQLYARQPIMAGNWKMNPATEADALNLANGFVALLGEMEDTCAMDEVEGCTEVVLFPPFPFISKVKDVVGKAGISVGSQQVYYEDKGAFTGSVAASMVKSVGCEYVLCGHSERRTLFSDDDVNINAKVKKTLEFDMKPILCIGETKEEFDLGITKEVCAMQVSKDLAGVSKADMANVVIAYEPVWAIGTGLVCDAESANEVHKFIRTILEKMYDKEVAQNTRIQYGGSVTPESVDGLMAMSDIDGCLVGGASLFADKFARIVSFKKE